MRRARQVDSRDRGCPCPSGAPAPAPRAGLVAVALACVACALPEAELRGAAGSTPGEGGGGSSGGGGAGATGGSGGEGGTAGGAGMGGAPACEACGCPTIFARGAFEMAGDPSGFGLDCAADRTFVDLGGCHAMRLEGMSQYCAHSEDLPTLTRAECLRARFRVQGDNTSASLIIGADGLIDEKPVYREVFNESLGTTVKSLDSTCRLPDGFLLEQGYVSFNRGSATGPMTVDYVELSIVDCDGTTALCSGN
jgi:hypothetical protein